MKCKSVLKSAQFNRSVAWVLLSPLFLVSACAEIAYDAPGMKRQCDKINDWNDRKACQQKADRYQYDFERAQSTK